MTLRRSLLSATALTFWTLTAHGQSVQQSGTVTPGHVASWTTTGIIQDAGTSTAGKITTFGVVNSSLQAIGINDSNISAQYHQLTFGSSPSLGYAAIDLENKGGATAENLYVINNGTQAITIAPNGAVTIPSFSYSGVVLTNGTIAGTLDNTGTIVGGTISGATVSAGSLVGTIAIGNTVTAPGASGLPAAQFNLGPLVFAGQTTSIAPALDWSIGAMSGTIGNGDTTNPKAPTYIIDNHFLGNEQVTLDYARILNWTTYQWNVLGGTGGRNMFSYVLNFNGAGAPEPGQNSQQSGVIGPHITVRANQGGSSSTVTAGSYYIMNPQIQLLPGATYQQLAESLGELDFLVAGNTTPETLTGTVTGGETLELNFSAPTEGINETVSYVAFSTDTLLLAATNLEAAVIADQVLNPAQIGAGSVGANNTLGNTIVLYSPLKIADLTITPSIVGSTGLVLTQGTMTTGASVGSKYGISFVSQGTDASQGDVNDTAILFGKQTAHDAPNSGGWQNMVTVGGGYALGQTDPTQTIDASGWPMAIDSDWFIANVPTRAGSQSQSFQPNESHSFAQLSQVYFSGGPFIFNGYNVGPDGSTQIGSTLLKREVGNAGTAGLLITANGWDGTTVTIANGGGAPNTGVPGGRYYPGQIVFDGVGGAEMITTTGSLGNVTGISVLVYPSAPSGSSPAATLYPVGGSGQSLALGVTWTAANNITIGGSGQTVNIIGGTLSPSSNVSNALLTPPATGGVARSLGTIALDLADWISFGADPTNGTADSAPFINDALSAARSGVVPNAYGPAGVYHIETPIAAGSATQGQCLEGDGDSTVLDVSIDFTANANGVVVMSGQNPNTAIGSAPCVKNLTFQFHQPPDLVKTAATAATAGATTVVLGNVTSVATGDLVVDVTTSGAVSQQPQQNATTTVTAINGSTITISPAVLAGHTIQVGDSLDFAQPTANFVNLGTCTLTAGSPGCIYPPAIYASGAGMPIVENVRISQGYSGIYIHGSGASTNTFRVNGVRVGALNYGIDVDDIHNFPQIDNFAMWNFGFNAASTIGGGPAFEQNYYNSPPKCFNFGATDGLAVGKMQCWDATGNLTSAWSWGSFGLLNMDGTNAAFTDAGVSSEWTQISNFYSTAAPSAAANLSLSNGYLQIANFWAQTTNTQPLINVTGGVLRVVNGNILQNNTGEAAATVTAGTMEIDDSSVATSATAWSTPLVSQTGTSGCLIMQGVRLAGGGSGTGISINHDSACSTVKSVNLGSWTFAAPGASGNYQTYVQAQTLGISGAATIESGQTAALTITANATRDIFTNAASASGAGWQFSDGNGINFTAVEATNGTQANHPVMESNTTGNPVIFAAAGSDSNISIKLGGTGTGEVISGGHLAVNGGGTPTASTCGGTGVISGVDSAFDVTIGGTSSATCTITPGNTFNAATHVSITPHQLASGNCAATTVSASSLVITCATATTNGVFSVLQLPSS